MPTTAAIRPALRPGLTESQRQQLVTGHIPLALSVARRYWQRFGGSIDDWRQDALVALVRASYYHDPAGQYAFSTLAFTAIGRRLREIARRQRERRLPGLVSMHLDDGEIPIAAAEVERIEPDQLEQLHTGLATLPTLERAAVVETFLRGRTLASIAADRGVTHQAVWQARQRGLQRLAEAMGT